MEQLRPIQRVAPPTPVDRREPHHREEQEGEPGEQAARPAAQAERADSPSVLVEGRAARLAGEADASDPVTPEPLVQAAAEALEEDPERALGAQSGALDRRNAAALL